MRGDWDAMATLAPSDVVDVAMLYRSEGGDATTDAGLMVTELMFRGDTR